MKNKKILYVEDNIDNRLLVKRILEAEGYIVIEASDGIEGIKIAQTDKPDLILMDLNLPAMDGQTAATRIKSMKGLENTIVVAITANVVEGEREKSLIAGCDGYIQKPVDVDKLPGRLEEYLNGKRERVSPRQEREYLRLFTQQLAEKLEVNIDLSHTDELTGIYNRRGFLMRLNQELSRARRFNHDLSCIIIDIDNFKQINDKYGHTVGDIVLAEISRILVKTLRKYELVARYGGEEFVVLLAEEDGKRALAVAERLRKKIQNYQFKISTKQFKTTVSLGISCFSSREPLSGEKLVQQADHALYQAKKNGKNQSILFYN
jgi:two-component system cell cycle response regulator